MAVISNLIVNLGAKTGQLDKAVDGTKKKVDGLKQKTSESTSKSAGLASMLGGKLAGAAGLAGGAFAKMGQIASQAFQSLKQSINQAFIELDKLGKTADKIGLSTEALAGLQHGAEQAGMSVEDINQVLLDLEKKTGEAAMGTGEAVAAFQKLQINARDFSMLDTDDKLDVLADKLQGVTNHSEKLAIANKLMGEKGAAALKLMENGSAGLKQYRQEAEAFGLTVTRQEAQGIEDMNDAWDEAKKSLVGVGRQLAVVLAPLLEKIGKILAEVGMAVVAFIKEWKPAFKEATETVSAFIDMLKDIVTSIPFWDQFSSSFGDVKESIINGFWVIQFAFRNWRDVLELGLLKVQLGFVTFGNVVHHIFSKVLPNIFSAFGNIWGNFVDGLKADWDELIKFISTLGEEGGNFGNVQKKMQEAFANVDLAREKGPLELELEARIAEKAGNLGQKLVDFLAEKLAQVAGDEKKRGERGEGVAPITNKVGALHRGSAEAFSVIAGSQRDKMWLIANDQLREQREQNKRLDKLLKRIHELATKPANL